MKKIIPYILTLLALLVISCSATKQSGKVLLENNKNIEIDSVLTVNNNDSLYFNQLRLHLSSALYLQKYMFKKFGDWDEAIVVSDYKNYLVWKNCKLFDEKDELYTVAASGIETSKEMYTSVIVQSQDNIDLLAKNSKLRDSLVSLFYYGAKKTRLSKDKFYRKYWEMRHSKKTTHEIN